MRDFLILPAIACLFLASSAAVWSAEEGIQHSFTTSGENYSFTGEFTVRAEKKCLLDMLYDPRQIRQYASHADDVKLMEEGEDWQTITYDYSSLFYRSKSTFMRRIDTETNRISYRLTDIEQHGLVSPEISSISGYYQISAASQAYRLTFYQQGVIGNGMLSGLYLYSAEKEAVDYLRNMRRYALQKCQ